MLIRLAFGLILAVVVAAGAAYIAYGEVEPCRMLAVHKANEAKENDIVDVLEVDMEPFYRAQTSQYSTSRCARELSEAWWARVRA